MVTAHFRTNLRVYAGKSSRCVIFPRVRTVSNWKDWISDHLMNCRNSIPWQWRFLTVFLYVDQLYRSFRLCNSRGHNSISRWKLGNPNFITFGYSHIDIFISFSTFCPFGLTFHSYQSMNVMQIIWFNKVYDMFSSLPPYIFSWSYVFYNSKTINRQSYFI